MATLARTIGAVVGGLMVAALVAGQESRRATAPAHASIRLEPFATPEAIGLWPVPSRDGIAVVTSCGVVHFFDAGSGDFRRAVPTGVVGWRLPVEGELAGY